MYLLSQMRILPYDFPWEKKKQEHNSIGEVLRKTKTVKERSQGSLSWYPLKSGDKIQSGDIVMTGEGSSAQIRIEGEGEIELGPSTFLSFGVDRSNPKRSILELEVDQGNVKLVSQKKALVVRLKDKKVEIKEDSVVQFTRETAAKNSKVEVKKGEMEISQLTPSNEVQEAVKVKEGEAVSVAIASEPLSEGKSEAVELPRAIATKIETSISPIFKSPLNEERIFLKESEQKISFGWEGEGMDRIEMSESSDFSNLRTYPVSGTGTQVSIPSGEYYWRLGKGNLLSSSQHFIAMPPVKYNALLPQIDSQTLVGKDLEIKWQGISKARTYQLQLSSDPEFKELLLDKKVSHTSEKISGLKAGRYFWRVKAEHEKLGEWPFSQPFTFSVKALLAPPKPKGVKKLKQSGILPIRAKLFLWASSIVMSSLFAEEEKITFEVEWEKTNGATGYLFELAEDKNFKKKILVKEINDTFIQLKVLKLDRYFWRVAGKDSEGELGEFSASQEVLLSEVWEPPAPKTERKKTVEEKPKRDEKNLPEVLPYWALDKFKVGLLGNYHTQSAISDGFKVEASGLPLARTEVGFYWHASRSKVLVEGWYEPHKYTSKNNLPEEFQSSALYQKEFGVRFLWGPEEIDFPLVFGLQYARASQFERTSIEGAQVNALNLYSLLIGVQKTFGEKKFARTTLLAEVSPLGDGKGIGLDARLDIGYKKLLFGILTPELNLGVRPSYYALTLQSQKVSTIAAFLGISLSWDLQPL